MDQNRSQSSPAKIGLAITGASGVIYGFRLLEELVRRNIVVHLTLSPNAKHIAKMEMGLDMDLETGRISGLNDRFYEWVIYHHHTHVGAAPASGSYGLKAVAIVPCSMGTLGRIATGTSGSLAVRMADVALKEKRPLILVPRETPYNTIHLNNMQILSQAGATILPASPGFYHQPKSVDEIVNFVVSRILQHLGFDGDCLIKGGWGEINSVSSRIHLQTHEDS
ncbi:MAG: UbiX family flavin prenyltransferase [Candidatus Omnitrophica bacterium]|nr:UbiX family flavin prenyltransferase [Candidatus Omnitrophota bacterium]